MKGDNAFISQFPLIQPNQKTQKTLIHKSFARNQHQTCIFFHVIHFKREIELF